MYISKYILNTNKPEIQGCLRDYEKMHKFTWKFFNIYDDISVSRKDLKLLYRVVNIQNQSFLFMYSAFKPSLIPEGVKEIYSVSSDTLFERLKERKVVNFNVLVNPVSQRDKKRIFLNSFDERMKWLNKYADKNGFKILNCIEKDVNKITVSKNKGFYFGVVEFQGVLEIENFDKFIDLVERGIGPEKPYGMGLILFSI